MRAVDLIQKKKENKEHTKEEIDFLITEYMKGNIEDYQMSAWLMAVCFNGLTDMETAYLTQAFINSGDILDFSDISEYIADKHSTGGVGDKVTLVLIPILAACDVYTAKLSGRGLGFTGGTIDKLESIPGFRCELGNDEFKKQIKDIAAEKECNITDGYWDFWANDRLLCFTPKTHKEFHVYFGTYTGDDGPAYWLKKDGVNTRQKKLNCMQGEPGDDWPYGWCYFEDRYFYWNNTVLLAIKNGELKAYIAKCLATILDELEGNNWNI